MASLYRLAVDLEREATGTPTTIAIASRHVGPERARGGSVFSATILVTLALAIFFPLPESVAVLASLFD